VPVQPPIVASEEQRPFGALADCQLDRPGGTRGKADGDDFAALAGDDQLSPSIDPRVTLR
jgi:hypothetical protein